MNEHEINRIAAALNQLRPDWPTAQLRTLLNDARITDRPRRDVCVALAWVACETGTSNPYRVLEAGPWWKAAAVDGTTTSNRDNPKAEARCTTCSLSQQRCRQLWSGDHEFTSAIRQKQAVEREQTDTAATVEALKAEVQPMRETAPTTTAPHTPRPELDDVRRELAAEDEESAA